MSSRSLTIVVSRAIDDSMASSSSRRSASSSRWSWVCRVSVAERSPASGVRRSCETAARSAVRVRLPASSCWAAMDCRASSSRSRSTPTCVANAAATERSRGPSEAPSSTSQPPAPAGTTTEVATPVGSSVTSWAARAPNVSRARSSSRGTSYAPPRTWRLSIARVPASRSAARASRTTAGRRVHHRRHRHRGEREDQQRAQVGPGLDVEGVQGRDEEVVEQQRAGDRGHDRGPSPADDRHQHREAQEQHRGQRDARRPRADVDQDDGEDRQAGRRQATSRERGGRPSGLPRAGPLGRSGLCHWPQRPPRLAAAGGRSRTVSHPRARADAVSGRARPGAAPRG